MKIATNLNQNCAVNETLVATSTKTYWPLTSKVQIVPFDALKEFQNNYQLLQKKNTVSILNSDDIYKNREKGIRFVVEDTSRE